MGAESEGFVMNRDIRLAVYTRDGGRCVRCGTERSVEGWSVHHRKPRGMGGSKNNPFIDELANLLLLCGSGVSGCHGHVERHREEGYLTGFLVHRAHDPEEVIVKTHRGWRRYLNDGTWEDGAEWLATTSE